MKLFLAGLLVGAIVVFPALLYLYVKFGFLSMETTAKPLPFEMFLAHTALHANIGPASDQKNPLPVTEENLLGGAKEYKEHCAACHGVPGQQQTRIAAAMFPSPPQFFQGEDMITGDPEGETFWKITHGIRLSGMPRFDTMPESERWQMTMLLKNADHLPASVQAALATR